MVMTQRVRPLVFMTDFGLRDAAVAAMKGVALGVSATVPLFDLTHDIPPFDVWEGAYRLLQGAGYWPEGTVFVSVVDPGVGTARRSVAVRSGRGQVFVNPDNGLLTQVIARDGLDAAIEMDETQQRLPGSEASYTFLGRDLYAYVGARLASGQVTMEDLGRPLTAPLVTVDSPPARLEGGALHGHIPVLDVNYGNAWTNVPLHLLQDLGARYGDTLSVTVRHSGEVVFREVLPFAHAFGQVPPGQALVYVNSLLHAAIGVNQGNFARRYGVASGLGWAVELARPS